MASGLILCFSQLQRWSKYQHSYSQYHRSNISRSWTDPRATKTKKTISSKELTYWGKTIIPCKRVLQLTQTVGRLVFADPMFDWW